MEPERKIEKLLRAFAKKRREQAGDPLELHPANRRLLQGEVARQSRKPEARGAWLGFLVKPQWIAALSVIASLGVLVLLLLPALNKSKREAEYASTRREPVRMRSMSEESVAAPANDSLAITASPVVNLSEDRAEKDKEGSAKVAPLVAPETPALARRDSPAQPSGSASLYFSSNNQAGESLARANIGTLQDSPKTLSVSAPTAGLSGELAKKQSEAGRPIDQLSGQKFKTVSNQLPVLATFEVIRDGSEIRIVDNDGSVYRGLLREQTNVLGVSDRVGDSVQTKADGSLNSSERHQRIELASERIFQVTGTNRTLNQTVVLSGELSFVTNQLQSASTNGGATGGSGGRTGSFQLLPIGSLHGSVTVGNGKSIPFQAEPAASTNR